MRPGLYLVHKPVGTTSFSVVRTFADEAARAGVPKLPLCHGGALDPFAEGLLVVLVGQATRLMDLVHTAPKTYVATVRWGVETDNGDGLGRAVFEGDATKLDPSALDHALREHLGWSEQVPPVHSNKKVGGEPAYKRVLRGEHVELPPSRVYLHAARFVSHALPHTSALELTCRGGYYVRALARDLGRTLGCGAHLSALSRPALGPYTDPGPGARRWVGGAELLPWCASRLLDTSEAQALRQGRVIARGEVLEPSWPLDPAYGFDDLPVRGLYDGRLVALLRPQGDTLVTFANLRGGL